MSQSEDWAKEALGIPKKSPKGKAPKARKPRKRKATKITGAAINQFYKPVTEKHPLKISKEEKYGGLAAAYAGRKSLQTAVGRATTLLAERAAAGSVGATLGLLGTAAMAGILAYSITSYVLARKDRQRATLQENAARAAQAYRFARQKIAEEQGRPLTVTQQKSLGRLFQAKLNELGLSKNDLSKLTSGDLD